MRVDRLRVDAFGRLRDLDSGLKPLPGLVVVHGPNEAGKTTFFHFLTSILYGFSPATRESHPYAPWSGAPMGGHATLQLGRGERWNVHRRLLSAPAASLVRGGREEDLRNRPLPCVEHVPLAVFRQVFALTAAELAGLGGEDWDAIQDRLVGAMGARDLVPARVVAERLEQDAGELWRPNRRGKQRVRELREQVRELKGKRPEVEEADRRLRDMDRERGRLQAELDAAREERQATAVYLERFRALLPMRQQLLRIADLEAEAGPPVGSPDVPADTPARLRQLEEREREAEERVAALDAEAIEPRARNEAFGPAEHAILARGDEIEQAAARVAGLETVRVRLGQLEQELRDLDRRLEGVAGEALTGGWSAVDAGLVRALPLPDVRRAVQRVELAREARRVGEEATRATVERAPIVAATPPRWPGLAAAVAGLVLVAVGLAIGQPFLTALGALALGVGLRMIWERRAGAAAGPIGGPSGGFDPAASDARASPQGASGNLPTLRAEETAANRDLAVLLAGLPLRDDVLDEGGRELVPGLERLQVFLLQRDDRERERTTHQAALDGLAAELAGLAGSVGLSLPADAAAASHYLTSRLKDAERRREQARAADRDLERVARERAAALQRRDGARGDRAELVRRLLLLDDDLERALHKLSDRVAASERARQLREELERGHPDLGEIRERIRRAEEAGQDWTLDDEALARRKVRLDELQEKVEAVGRALEGLSREIDHRGGQETLDVLDGQIEALEDELAAAVRERDRRFVLARLVREADRRFREEHQPDVLRRAGEHLSAITAGRYTRILVGEEERGGRFRLKGSERPQPVPVDDPLSQGTREQVYLAVRLAVVDHLDQAGERLPLFMDETFVNWDRDRRARGLELLTRLAKERQVFLFTCHEGVAEALAGHGAGTIRLPTP